MKKLYHFIFLGKTYRVFFYASFLIVFLLYANNVKAQGPEWLTTIGGNNPDYIAAVEQDENGNIYACGYFSGTVDFNPDETATDEYTSSGATSGFITKYSSDGTYLWTTVLDGTQHNWIIDLTIIGGYRTGVYVAGTYSGQIDFDPGSSSVSYTAEDSYDAFVAGYDLETGELLQEYVYAGTSAEFATSITSYGDNHLVVAGTFRGQIDFDPFKDEKVLYTSNGESDFFIRNFSPAGGAFWTRRIGGTGNDLLNHRTLELDANNNIYLGGSFQDVVDFDPDNTTTHEMTSEGGKDAFLLALNSSAQFLWSEQIGNANDESTTALTLDSTGIYSAMNFTGTVSIVVGYAGGMPIYEDFTSNGGEDILLMKHNFSGAIVDDNFGHIGGDLDDQCNDLMTDTVGHVLATGYFMSSDFDLNPQDETQIFASHGGKDIFMAAFSDSYDYEWANKYGGTDDDEGVNLLYKSRKIYCAGIYRNTVNFDLSTVTSNGQSDFFILATSIWNTETEILEFDIPQAIAPENIDEEASTIDIEVGYGVDLTALTPTITISMGASIDPPSGVAQDFTSPKIYTVLAENGSESQNWTVTVTEAPSTETDVLTFELAESTGAADIDPVNATVDIEVTNGTDLTSLVPTITVSTGATIDPASGVAQNFSSPVDYTVTAENGTNTRSWTVTVTVAEEPNDETEILTFELTESTGPADIDPAAGTVDIEVANGTDLTTLEPTITLSPGATIDPASGVAQDFTNSVNYTVTAENGTDSQEWSVSVVEAVSVSELSPRTISIYPNPATQVFHFNSETPIHILKIYDMTGRFVMSKIFNSYSGIINVQELPKGIYFIRVHTETGKTTNRRIIID